MTPPTIISIKLFSSEAATGGVMWKKVFLKIPQNSQENTCARVFFYETPVPESLYFSRSSQWRCYVKKNMFLETSQNSQENTCAGASFLIKLKPATLLRKRLWHRCFPVNFAKLLRASFLQNTLGPPFLFLLLFAR